ncbi:MAG: molecular chaperone DnaJ [Pseudomonadota bacterium]
MAAAKRDYYDVLGVPRDADEKAIKNAFRALAMQYHPDRNKAPDAEERFKEIAEAYAILSDPNKRREYDTAGHAGVAGFSTEDLFAGINFDDLFGGLGFNFGSGFGGGPFEGFFHHRRTGPERGANLESDLEIPLERVLNGGEETVRIVRPATCASCKGTGARSGTQPKPCKTCNGTGQKTSTKKQVGILFQRISTCPDCHGRGVIIENLCPECQGQGRVERVENIKIRIPVGVEEAMALRIPRHGMPSPQADGPPGDLFVVVRTRADTRFERRGVDLWRSETLEIADAVLGTNLHVPTLDGPVTVKIAAGTQPDEVLRLKGKGLPQFGDGRRGDMYVRLQVHVPEKLSDEERRLYLRLRQLASRHGKEQ